MDKSDRITMTWTEWQQIKSLADRRMKAKNGHRFETILKTRCIYCRRGPRVRTRCGAWFHTFLSEVDAILLNLERERTGGSLTVKA